MYVFQVLSPTCCSPTAMRWGRWLWTVESTSLSSPDWRAWWPWTWTCLDTGSSGLTCTTGRSTGEDLLGEGECVCVCVYIYLYLCKQTIHSICSLTNIYFVPPPSAAPTWIWQGTPPTTAWWLTARWRRRSVWPSTGFTVTSIGRTACSRPSPWQPRTEHGERRWSAKDWRNQEASWWTQPTSKKLGFWLIGFINRVWVIAYWSVFISIMLNRVLTAMKTKKINLRQDAFVVEHIGIIEWVRISFANMKQHRSSTCQRVWFL